MITAHARAASHCFPRPIQGTDHFFPSSIIFPSSPALYSFMGRRQMPLQFYVAEISGSLSFSPLLAVGSSLKHRSMSRKQREGNQVAQRLDTWSARLMGGQLVTGTGYRFKHRPPTGKSAQKWRFTCLQNCLPKYVTGLL